MSHSTGPRGGWQLWRISALVFCTAEERKASSVHCAGGVRLKCARFWRARTVRDRADRWLLTPAPGVLGQDETVCFTFTHLQFVEISFIGALKKGTNEAANIALAGPKGSCRS